MKEAELAKTHKIEMVVSKVQWLTKNKRIIAIYFLGIREELITINKDQ